MKKVALRLLLLGFGACFALLGMEFVLRVFFPDSAFGAADKIPVDRGAGVLFVEDKECGYLAPPNTPEYDAFACVRNHYPAEKPPGKTRLLFAGDSVTHRGLIMKGLEEVAGDKGYEYWNAGVESYNPRQEVTAYRRWNHLIHPDHVILTFHPNDFFMTPVLRSENGRVLIYTPRRAPRKINYWLFANSYLYRWAVGTSLGWKDQLDRVGEVREQLTALRDLTEKENVRLSVLLLPTLMPMDQWIPEEKWSRTESLKLFQELGLPYYDLLDTFLAHLKTGDSGQETPNDRWHPNAKLASEFARYAYEKGLLKEKPQGAAAGGPTERP